MLIAVIPVFNEEKRLKKALLNATAACPDLIIPVFNGCTDNSLLVVKEIKTAAIYPLIFHEPLGIDVPRAAGAKAALDFGASAVLFLDGDMEGDIGKNLRELVHSVTRRGMDMALTDCYPQNRVTSPLARKVIEARLYLNRTIGLEKTLGAASPSHGPHAVSRRFLTTVPLRELAIPPVSLALAAVHGLAISAGTCIPHHKLGSPSKDPAHAAKIAETIIGDCLEAVCAYRGKTRTRIHQEMYYDGYHSARRLDLLEQFLARPFH